METKFCKRLVIGLLLCIGASEAYCAGKLHLSGVENNDLYQLLQREGIEVNLYGSAQEAIASADKGDGVIITAPAYPSESVVISEELQKAARQKNLKLYAEFVSEYPGLEIADTVMTAALERGVISSKFFEPGLKEMSLLGLNGCRLYNAEVSKPLISFAKVAGFDTAQYGLTDTDVYPLLWLQDKNTMLSSSCLSKFATARYAPTGSWSKVLARIVSWLSGKKINEFANMNPDPRPSYGATDQLPEDAAAAAVRRGAEWLYNGRFMIHPSWRDWVEHYQGDGLLPVGPPAERDFLVGDGSHGVLEGHTSTINHDGREQYRYWLRADVQGEVSFLLAAASKLTGDEKYAKDSEHVLDYLFYTSNFIDGERKNRESPSFGLIGWSETHPGAFYNDDNARCILGAAGASALLGNTRWNKQIADCIMANLRLTSRQGFLPNRIDEPELLVNGADYYAERDFVNPHPHFGSWMWACYLWLYDKTGYSPLLDKAKSAIKLTMDAYPDNWHWTNGIQQERARMILPLAWLVRVEDTEEHRAWLDAVVQKLLENQAECGAIREELGDDSFGTYGKTKNNRDYGVTEAPLIGENGDPVADMLYTSNFAFFALNEAAQATGREDYKNAVGRLSDFLIRAQVKSDKHADIDGAWLRAFDYNRWDYWASNADSGWGAWSTLTGWIQSWIVGTQVLLQSNSSYWDVTKNVEIEL